MRIPFHKPNMPNNLNAIMTDSIRDGWLTTGSQVNIFEKRLAKDYQLQRAIDLIRGVSLYKESIE